MDPPYGGDQWCVCVCVHHIFNRSGPNNPPRKCGKCVSEGFSAAVFVSFQLGFDRGKHTIEGKQWTTAAQDEGEWHRTAKEGTEFFMTRWFATERARACLLYTSDAADE